VRYGLWIRRATGQLSVDVMASRPNFSFSLAYDIPPADNILTLDEPNLETNAIDSLTLECCHDVCALHLGQYHHIFTPAQELVKLGAILPFSSGLAGWVEIASLTEPKLDCSSWLAYPDAAGETTIEGWIQYFLHPPGYEFVLTC
jgi:hypothetical protein